MPGAVTQASWQRLHHQLQLGDLQSLPQCAVRAFLLWVQVESGERHREFSGNRVHLHPQSSDGELGAERGPLRKEVFGKAGGGPTNAGLCLMRKAVQRAELARGWGWRGSGSHLMVPLKRTGSCRMMDRRERSVCSGNLAMSMPSMMMRPVERER